MLRYELMRAGDGVQFSHSDQHILEAARTQRGPSRTTPAAGSGPSFGRLKKDSPKREPHPKVLPQAVLRSFNTWAFKREQPADLHLLMQSIGRSIARDEPVSFVLYWGKGPRATLEQPDIECLDHLNNLARRVREAYVFGATFKLVFTDTHAELNGHSYDSMREYFGVIENAARDRGFGSCWLGDLVQSARVVLAGETSEHDVPEDTLRRLSVSAAKWYRGDGTPEDGALRYYRMNMLEKRAVELAFPNAIFVTFNGSDMRSLFPDRLPIFYSYSLRRGFSVKPWFLPPVAPAFDPSLVPSLDPDRSALP